jgi:glutathione S-transferase
MTTYRLTYFDVDGGRGEPIRIALHAAGIDFEDHRISFEEFGRIRSELRFSCVPVLEIDGEQYTQSNALTRYIGAGAGLYPSDPMQALYCDEAMGAVEDMTNALVRTFGLEGDELRAARSKLAQGRLSMQLRGLEQLLVRGGGEYFADNRLTIADLKVFVQTRWFGNGALDHIPTDLVETAAPKLAEHRARIQTDPIVVAWYSTRQGS